MSTIKKEIKEKSHHRLRQTIDYQRKTLDYLFDIAKTLNSTTDFSSLLKNIVEIILSAIDAQSGVIWLLNQESLKICYELSGCSEAGCQAFHNPDMKCWNATKPLCCDMGGEGLETKIRECINCKVFEGGIMKTAISIGMTPEIIEPTVLSIGEGLCKELIMRHPQITVFHIFPSGEGVKCYRQTEWVPDDNPHMKPNLVPANYCFLETSLSNPKTRIGIVLMTNKKLLGILCIALDRAHYLTENEANLLINIARLTSISIENAELYCLAEKRYQQIKTLLKEAHHRIKNNLQTIAGLFSMQLEKDGNREIRSLLLNNLTRVKSISTVHQLLSQEELMAVKLSSLIERVIGMIIDATESRDKISYSVSDSDIHVPSRSATSLALIINELTTNSIKHGIADRGKIDVKIKTENGRTFLDYSDNGRGLPVDFKKNLGLQIVSTLVEEDLEGTFELFTGEGTTAKISFGG